MPITINGSTGISGVDGSAGTPALIGSDADTGLVFAAGQVSASVNGTVGNVPLVQGTAQASTSGTSIDFTGIPSWAKRVTVMLNGVSTNGTAQVGVQLGTSSGIESSGYVGSINDGFSGSTNFSSAFLDNSGSTASTRQFVYTLSLVSSNTWICQIVGAFSNAAGGRFGAGTKTLSGTLDRVRITTANGTDTFDAGSINILYE